MMSQSQKTESLFYYFQLDDHIPENHLLRLIDRYVDFSFVRERLKESYSQVGRPSIDPQVLLRLLLSVISMGSPANTQGPISTSSQGRVGLVSTWPPRCPQESQPAPPEDPETTAYRDAGQHVISLLLRLLPTAVKAACRWLP